MNHTRSTKELHKRRSSDRDNVQRESLTRWIAVSSYLHNSPCA